MISVSDAQCPKNSNCIYIARVIVGIIAGVFFKKNDHKAIGKAKISSSKTFQCSN